MSHLPATARKYLIISLDTTPAVFESLLGGISAEDPVWDKRPDPERFTLREMMAHVADWDAIFLERLSRTRTETKPLLLGIDEGQLAIDRNYGQSDPIANLQRLRSGRNQTVAFLKQLGQEEWDRVGVRDELGPMTIDAQATLILAHDGYHVRQAIESLKQHGA